MTTSLDSTKNSSHWSAPSKTRSATTTRTTCPQPLTVGVSGVSSSGKTTLAQHLAALLKSVRVPEYAQHEPLSGVGSGVGHGIRSTDGCARNRTSNSNLDVGLSPDRSMNPDLTFNPTKHDCSRLHMPKSESLKVTLVHQDHFYLPNNQIPIRNGIQDWDGIDAFDWNKIVALVKSLQAGEPLPEEYKKKVEEDQPQQNMINQKHNQNPDWDGETFPSDRFERLRLELEHALKIRIESGLPPLFIILLDGILLFPFPEPDPCLNRLLDLRLLLRVSRSTAARRRASRPPYPTPDGEMWHDPPGYFDDFVWNNYEEAHARLYVDGDVEGPLDKSVCAQEQIIAIPDRDRLDLDITLSETLECAVQSLIDLIKPTSTDTTTGSSFLTPPHT